MPVTWRAVGTVGAGLVLAAVPLLILIGPVEDAFDRLPPAAWIVVPPVVMLVTGGWVGWLSRPAWLALAAFVAAVIAVVLGLRSTIEPCPPDAFCEGFTPQGYAMLFGSLAIWPWSFLGLLGGTFVRQSREQGGAQLGQWAAYIFGGLVLAWLAVAYAT